VAWLFQRYFWIFKLLCLALSALIVAGAINAVIASSFRKSFAVIDADVAAGTKKVVKTVQAFELLNQRNLFEAKRETVGRVRPGRLPQKEKRPVGDWTNAVATKLPLKLLGTAVFENADLSLATISKASGRSSGASIYNIQECGTANVFDQIDQEDAKLRGKQTCNDIGGLAKLVRVEPEIAYIFNNSAKQYEFLELEGGHKLPRKKISKPGSGALNLGKGIRKTDKNSYEIDKTEFDAALANLSKIATQARAVPAFENGNPVGYRIFNIKPGSVFQKIGLKNGDVIKKINGYDLSSPDKAMELYQKLKTSRRFNMDLKRNGSSRSMEYTVR